MNNIGLITAIGFILFMSRGITGPINSLYMEKLGANYVAIGLLGTVTSLTTILFSYLWGRASDRSGNRKQFLSLGLALLALSFGAMAIISRYEYLFILNFVNAAAQAAYMTVSLALMGDLLEERAEGRGRRMGTYRGLGSLGFGLMAFVAGSVADRWSLKAPFILAAVFSALGWLLVQGVKEPKTAAMELPPASSETPDTAPPSPHGLPLLPLLTAAFLWSLVIGAVYAVWANYMVNEIGYRQAAMSRLWALASLSEVPLMIVAGQLSDRVGRLPMLSVGLAAWGLVFLGYVFIPQQPWIIGVQLLRGFAYSAFTATAMTYAAEVRARAERGRASGLYNAAGGIGAILGSSLGGVVTQISGFHTMILGSAAIVFGGSITLAGAAVSHNRRRRSPPNVAPAAQKQVQRTTHLPKE
jgi:MFS family permease